MGKQKPRAKPLGTILRDRLGDKAEMKFQDVDAMADGHTGQTNQEIIAANIITAACNGERWAIELLRDTAWGKPGQAVQDDDLDRSSEDRLEDFTRRHLNDLAASVVGSAAAPVVAPAVQPQPANPVPHADAPVAPDDAAAPARRLLDVPKDRDRDSEDA